MKYLLTLALCFFHLYLCAQVSNGVYKSTKSSFRENYFLVIEGKKVIFYGWELNADNDTFYYRSPALFDKSHSLFFERFEFSRQNFLVNKAIQFYPDSSIMLEPFLLHRRLINVKQTKDGISLLALKDIYDNRADEFYFKKMQW